MSLVLCPVFIFWEHWAKVFPVDIDNPLPHPSDEYEKCEKKPQADKI